MHIFQAFDEYVQKIPLVDSKQRLNQVKQGKKIKEVADIREIEDFALGEDLDPLGGQIIDFHPSQNLTPEQANMHARENADTEKDVVNDDK